MAVHQLLYSPWQTLDAGHPSCTAVCACRAGVAAGWHPQPSQCHDPALSRFGSLVKPRRRPRLRGLLGRDNGVMHWGNDEGTGLQHPQDRADAAVRRLIAAARGLDHLPFIYQDPLAAPFECYGKDDAPASE